MDNPKPLGKFETGSKAALPIFKEFIEKSVKKSDARPFNAIWRDQTLAVNLAKDVLNGEFPLVGYLHSNRMHSFPAFYYLIAPLVYISDDPIFLYFSVAVMNILGVMIVTSYIYSKYSFQEYVLYLLFSIR